MILRSRIDVALVKQSYLPRKTSGYLPEDRYNDEVWRLAALGIGRRVDLHLSQRAENDIRDALIKIIANREAVRNKQRRIAAVEALRQMRPEALLPVMGIAAHAVLREVYDDDLLAEFLLLIRRVFTHRHLSVPVAFQQELRVADELDQAAARANPGSPRRIAIDRINFEWGRGPQPRFNLPEVIRKLESILKTQRHPEHRLLYELAEYISDERADIDKNVKGALDNAVRAASLGANLISLLEETGRLHDTDLEHKNKEVYDKARELRRWVISHMHKIEPREPRVLREKMEDLKEFFAAIGTELESQFVDPADYLESAWEKFKGNMPLGLRNITTDVDVRYLLPKPVLVVIDTSLFQEIIRNLLQNLKHAINTSKKNISAIISLSERFEQPGPDVSLNVKCFGGDKRPELQDIDDSTIMRFFKEAEIYGVEHYIADTERLGQNVSWDETWNFWKL